VADRRSSSPPLASLLRPPRFRADEEGEEKEEYVRSVAAARGEQARASLVAALREAGDLADAVQQLQGDELLETLEYVDSLRLGLTESNQALQGAVRSDEAQDGM